VTTTQLDGTAISEVADLATKAAGFVPAVEGLFILPNGQVIDVRDRIETGRPFPNRKKGSVTVTETIAFLRYLEKHGLDQTELYGNAKRGIITAIINADHATDSKVAEGLAGWSDHQVTLNLPFTTDWKEWTAHNNEYRDQATFAEFIEDHLTNFVEPTGADMLELAQSFNATTRVDFESSSRVSNGESRLGYRENTSASAGKTGSLTIPDTFTIGIQVYERGPLYAVTARFRYRIVDAKLRLAYKLNRPEDVLNAAFDDVLAEIGEKSNREVWLTP